LYQELIALTKTAEAQRTLDGLSGELFPSLNNALLAQDLSFMRALSKRVSLSSGERSGGQLLASLAPSSGSADWSNNLWVTVEGVHMAFEGNANAGRAVLTGPEVTLGYDRGFTDGWFGGLAMRLGDKLLKVDSRDSKADIKTISIALFGGKETQLGDGVLRLLMAGEYSRHDLDTERLVLVGNHRQKLEADQDVNSWLFWLESAYRIGFSNGNALEPFLSVGWHNLRLKSLEERGGTAALRKRGESCSHSLGTIGLRSKIKAHERLTVDLDVGWRHLFGKKVPEGLMAFAQGGDPFRVKGVPLSRDEVIAGLGLNLTISENIGLVLDYQGAFGAKSRSHAGGLSLKVSW
jgi:outer membrane autotransporter protein